jgi:chromosome segregation protein
MRLKALTLKGFKSFPDRTRLDFGPGVSVVVGPNGSGKSNVTDAVLWAMGEQSPLAVRGQSMQDVIFGGGRGVQARNAAEVEIVLDNSDGTVDLPVSEISIVRHLDRAGEGEYRLNGAKCRLVDVIEVLSDTGLGKETHSVISQGRVEAIVTSKPRDRRLLIEEAAGLGKHRKRRRRAQLKLERTQENLDRALDVEREARMRLRPLKRQAEAAELHERLERQMLEARWQLAREAVRARRLELAQAEAGAQEARAARAEIEARLQAVVVRRGQAERALAERAEQHDALARRAYGARSARERLQMRHEQTRAASQALAERMARIERELASHGTDVEHGADVEESPSGAHPEGHTLWGAGRQAGRQSPEETFSEDRIEALEAELAEIDEEREREVEREIEGLARDHEQAGRRVAELEQAVSEARTARERADAAAEAAREHLRASEREVQDTRREAARVGAELAVVNQFLRSHAGSSLGRGGADAPQALSETLQVQAGYELALAAVLGGRLDAAVVDGLAEAEALLDGAGQDGGAALLAHRQSGAQAQEGSSPTDGAAYETVGTAQAPAPGAQRLAELVQGPEPALGLARRLLAEAWVVERLEDLPEDFQGTAVTRGGRVWLAAWGEVRQMAEGGAERVLARRNEREALIAASEKAVQAEHVAKAAAEEASRQTRAAEQAREEADAALRAAERTRVEGGEEQRRLAWLIEQRRVEPEQGALAVRRAQLEGELASERRQAERVARERAERKRRLESLRAQLAADTALAPLAERLAAALQSVGEAVAGRVGELEQELVRDREAGEAMAAELSACAASEAEIQAGLRAQGEAVTSAEVAAQRLRDQFAEAELELCSVVERLGVSPAPETAESFDARQAPSEDARPAEQAPSEGAQPLADGPDEQPEPLGEEEEQALRARVERLQRRREQLGPVNPLAQEEYAEALEHVEELESRRTDLETALRELRGVIRDTDRQIHETFHATFTAAASNFEELVGDVFPGGSGRLRLVQEEPTRRPVLGGQSPDGESAAPDTAADAEAAAEREAEQEQIEGDALEGVEIEITPAGKSSKRLSLLSGGEKSMTALAFLFAVFLARPCPFYILDEVEAALDDLNLDRFLALLRRYAGRAQFIVITHQKRTMEAADWLYGVSMGGDGVSKILSRRLPPAAFATGEEAGGAVAGGAEAGGAEVIGDRDTVGHAAQAPQPTITKAA